MPNQLPPEETPLDETNTQFLIRHGRKPVIKKSAGVLAAVLVIWPTVDSYIKTKEMASKAAQEASHNAVNMVTTDMWTNAVTRAELHAVDKDIAHEIMLLRERVAKLEK